MRTLCFSLVLCASICLSSQQRNNGGFGGQANFPVKPGDTPNSAVGSRGCFCLPANQLCDPNGPVPRGAQRSHSRPVTRIINLSPETRCPQEQRECCFGSGGPPIGGGGDNFPSPPLSCGISKSLFPGTAIGDQAEFGKFPWMTAILQEKNNFVAGGVLVSANAVVTAAHKLTKEGALKVRLGDYDLSVPNEFKQFPHQEFKVVQVIFHPRYNPETLANDIAILKLAPKVKFQPHINPICLPEPGQRFSQRCYVAGWGTNEIHQFQNIMKQVDLPIVDELACQESLRRTKLGPSFTLDTRSFLCAGGEFGKDTCKGDGGSPLACQEGSGIWTVVGLVAWGIGCGQDQVPGVYVNVATYSDFIKQNL